MATKAVCPDCRVVIASLPSLPFEYGTFGLITAIEVVYYLTQDQRERSYDELVRLLAPNGWLLVTGKINAGSGYFDIGELERALSQRITVKKRRYIYNRPYYAVESVGQKYLCRFRELRTRVGRYMRNRQKEEVLPTGLSFVNRCIWRSVHLRYVPLFAFLIFLTGERVLFRLLGVSWLWRAAGGVARWMVGPCARSHVIVLAKKE